jgi:hypothetical protein
MTLENMVREQVMTAASDKINFIYNKLNTPDMLAKLPLHVFNQYFAPYFFGQKPLERDSDMFSAWVGIAGSPMAPVEIIDNDKVVFVVPALYDTNAINLMKGNSVSRVMDEFSNHSNSLPAVSMKFVQNRLLPEADQIAKPTTGNNEQWQQIASHYVPIEPKTSSSQTSKGSLVNNSDDDLNYDI